MFGTTKAKFLLLLGACALMFSAALPAWAAQYEVTRWEIVGEQLEIELNHSDVRRFNREAPPDRCFVISGLPIGTQFLILNGWTVDVDYRAVTYSGGKSEPIAGQGYGMKLFEGNTVVLNDGTVMTARYTAPAPSTPPIIAAHYVTWYKTPEEYDGRPLERTKRYAYRWTLKSEAITSLERLGVDTSSGQAKLASYQYPLAGPYDSADPDLLKYHAALMKMSGIDAVVIDFYGIRNIGEYGDFLDAAKELVKILEESGLKFLVHYEEFAIKRAQEKGYNPQDSVREDFAWLARHWFNKDHYIKHDERPVVFCNADQGVFRTLSEWEPLLGTSPKPFLMDRLDAFTDSQGAFHWVYPSDDINVHFSGEALKNKIEGSGGDFKYFFDKEKERNHSYFVAVAFPGFDDRIKENGEDPDDKRHGTISYNGYDGKDSFERTFDKSIAGNPAIIQLVTWNDFVEGTTIEPSMNASYDDYDKNGKRAKRDQGYKALEYLQAQRRNQDSNFSWTAEDLRAPIELYKLMKGTPTEEQKAQVAKAYDYVLNNNPNPEAFRALAKSIVNYDVNSELRPRLFATGITLNENSMSLMEGGTRTLTATLSPEGAVGAVTWDTSDAAVATVRDGTVTAVAPGTATIMATVNGTTLSASCEVTVSATRIPAENITLNKTQTTLTIGGRESLGFSLTPEEATDPVDWHSSNNSIATVSDGMVTAKAPGTAKITATANGHSAICEVTVISTRIPADNIKLNKTETTLTTGSSETLIATLTPLNATDPVSWRSSEDSIATVSSAGEVRGVAPGTATITATANGHTASCTVTVSPVRIPATGISLNKNTTTLTIGGTETLNATLTPAGATDAVTWTSDKETVAKVSSTGEVTAVSNGTATITAKVEGTTLTATCTVTINPVRVPPTAISLNKNTMTLTVDGSETLSATLTPNNATDPVNWSSNNDSIATVSSAGEVRGVALGMATITAKVEGTALTATCAVTVTGGGGDTLDMSDTQAKVVSGSNDSVVTVEVTAADGTPVADKTLYVWLQPVGGGQEVGPFRASTDSDGRLQVSVDNLLYADGSKGSISAGTYRIQYADTAAATLAQRNTVGQTVTLRATNTGNLPPDEGNSGGCSAGFTALAVAALAAYALRRRA